MVRETRHLWVGNLPDNIREDRIREHFKRYGRVQNVKLLSRAVASPAGGKEASSPADVGGVAGVTTGSGISGGGVCAAVAFMDIKSASKAHNCEHKLDERSLTTEYYEPAAIPSSAGSSPAGSGYSGSSGSAASGRFPPNHGTPDDHPTGFVDRGVSFYERTVRPEPEGSYLRRSGGYLTTETLRGRARDRLYNRNGPYTNTIIDRGGPIVHHRVTPTWYDGTVAPSLTRGYGSVASAVVTPDVTYEADVVPSRTIKKKSVQVAKSRSGSESPGGSISSSRSRSRSRSRSGSRSRSRSSCSSSRSGSSSESRASSSPRSSRAPQSSAAQTAGPAVHSEDRRPLAICVRNLPARSSDTSLKDGLFHEYKKHGKVTWVKVVGQSADRYALVCFKKADDAEKALEVSRDKLFFGCKIDVAPYQGYDVDDNEFRPYEAELDEYHPKATRTLFIGNLEKDVTVSELRKHFEVFGEIIEIDIKKQGAVSSYAFCQYSDICSVVKAMRTMDGEHLGNNRIKLGFGKTMPTNCVWMDGIAESVGEKQLSALFLQYGPVSQVTLDRERGLALVFFEQILFAQSAIKETRGVTLRGRKLQVDFASRECQEAFYEKLDKSTSSISSSSERTTVFDVAPPVGATTPRFTRYDAPARPRTASYSRSGNPISAASAGAVSPGGPPGANTPRGRARLARYPPDYYDSAGEYTERRFRSYDEFSQGSGASHEDIFEHDVYVPPACYSAPDSSEHARRRSDKMVSPVLEDDFKMRAVQSVVIPADLQTVGTTTFPPPDIRHLQKERVHLLEQLEECPSSGDEMVSPKKRLKLDSMCLDNLSTSGMSNIDGNFESLTGNHCDSILTGSHHRSSKCVEVRRLSDSGTVRHLHCSRRPSGDNVRCSQGTDRLSNVYTPHSVCKRRKTGGSSEGEHISRGRCHPLHSHHAREASGGESADGSRPGTPLCDERPEILMPVEPRRIPERRDRERSPLSLPLPRFAEQIFFQNKSNEPKAVHQPVVSSPPVMVTSPRLVNTNLQIQQQSDSCQVPPPASPPTRLPLLSPNSSDSEAAPPSPSLEERIKSLDEKYEKWSGSRAFSHESANKIENQPNAANFRVRHKLLELDINEVQPSDILKSVLARPSVFDEDSKRLENIGDKYEPKEFVPSRGQSSSQNASIPQSKTSPLITLPIAASGIVANARSPRPKTPPSTPKSAPAIASVPVKGLQYPFPSHPPILMNTPVSSASSTCNNSVTKLASPIKGSAAIDRQFSQSSKILTKSLSVPGSTNSGTISYPESNVLNSVSKCLPMKTGLQKDDSKCSDKNTVYKSELNSKSKNVKKSKFRERNNHSESDNLDRRKDVIDKTSELINNPGIDLENNKKCDKSECEPSDKQNDEKEQKCDSLTDEKGKRKERDDEKYLHKEKSGKEKFDVEKLESTDKIASRKLNDISGLEKEKYIKENADKGKDREILEKERNDRERQIQNRLEKEKLESEKLEKERLQKESHERECLEKRLEKERREKDRREKERDEKERLEKIRLERERVEKERIEKERVEKERIEKERIDKERLEKERLEKERLEKERLEKERTEKERLEKERLEKERLEKERLEKERLEKERLEKERLEKERLEKERLEKERLEKERLEKERLEKERLEKERLEKERLEKERLEKERLEKERVEKERLEKERLEKERLEKERIEKERIEKERIEKERIEKERIEKDRIEKDRIEKERLEKERIEKDRIEKQRLEKERLEKERIEKEKLEKVRLEKERLEKENIERERLIRIRTEKEKERLEKERIEKERLAKELLEKEKLEGERSEKETLERDRSQKERHQKEIVERERSQLGTEKERIIKERLDRECFDKQRLEKERDNKENNEKRFRKDRTDEDSFGKEHFRSNEENFDKTNLKYSKDKSDKEHLEKQRSSRDKSNKEKDIDEEKNKKDQVDASDRRDKKLEKDKQFNKELLDKNSKVINNTTTRDEINSDNKQIYESVDQSIDKLDSGKTDVEFNKSEWDDIITSKSETKRREKYSANCFSPAVVGCKRRNSCQDQLCDESLKRCKIIQEEHIEEHIESRNSKEARQKDRSKALDKREKDKRIRVKTEKVDRIDKPKLSPALSPTLPPPPPPPIQKKINSKENMCANLQPTSPPIAEDFLARLELRSSEEDEKQRAQRKELKEKKRQQQLQQIQQLQLQQEALQQQHMKQDERFITESSKPEDIRKKEKEKRVSIDRKGRDESAMTPKSNDNCKRKVRRVTNNSTDTSDSDEPKKHSIFDIVDDGPTYISMYDKVKARSCKNMQKQEEEKRQEKIKAKFSQLKQSRAKREEKKRSMSWDGDSDSEQDRSSNKQGRARSGKSLITSSSEDEHNAVRKSIEMRSDMSGESAAERTLSSRRGSRSRITSDTSEDEHARLNINNIKTEVIESETEIDDKSAISISKIDRLTSPTESKLHRKDRKSRDNKIIFLNNSDAKIKQTDINLSQIIKNEVKAEDIKSEIKSELQSNVNEYNEYNDSVDLIYRTETENNCLMKENIEKDAYEDVEKVNTDLRKKHKKKQKRQKTIDNENLFEKCFENHHHTNGSAEAIENEVIKTGEYKKHMSKKDKKRDKMKDDSDKDKTKPKKIRKVEKLENSTPKQECLSNSSLKREEKIQNIFGSFSDDESPLVKKVTEISNIFHTIYNSDYKQDKFSISNENSKNYVNNDKAIYNQTFQKEKHKEDSRRRKEKKKKDRERKLARENDISVDMAEAGRVLEAQLMNDLAEESTETTTHEEISEGITMDTVVMDKEVDVFRFTDGDDSLECDGSKSNISGGNLSSKKEFKEKKKKKKRNKEDKQNRKDHHHHHHEKNRDKNMIADNLIHENHCDSSGDIERLAEQAQNDGREDSCSEIQTISSNNLEQNIYDKTTFGTDKSPDDEKANTKEDIINAESQNDQDESLSKSDDNSNTCEVNILNESFSKIENDEILELKDKDENILQSTEDLSKCSSSVLLGTSNNQNLETCMSKIENNILPQKTVTNTIVTDEEQLSHTIKPIEKRKTDKLIPGFGIDIDEKIHENAVKSISDFIPARENPEIIETLENESNKSIKPDKLEEKPRVVISQEETEDAVAALLGESFGSSGFEQYDEQTSPIGGTATATESNIADEEAEEMRQAVQSLKATEIDGMKPDTPQSESDLQIDTDTEDNTEECNVNDSQNKSLDSSNLCPTLVKSSDDTVSKNDLSLNTDIRNDSNINNIFTVPVESVISSNISKEIECKATVTVSKEINTPSTVISNSWRINENRNVKDSVELNVTKEQQSAIEHLVAVSSGPSGCRPANVITQNRPVQAYMVTTSRVPTSQFSHMPAYTLQPSVKNSSEQITVYKKPVGVMVSSNICTEVRHISHQTTNKAFNNMDMIPRMQNLPGSSVVISTTTVVRPQGMRLHSPISQHMPVNVQNRNQLCASSSPISIPQNINNLSLNKLASTSISDSPNIISTSITNMPNIPRLHIPAMIKTHLHKTIQEASGFPCGDFNPRMMFPSSVSSSISVCGQSRNIMQNSIDNCAQKPISHNFITSQENNIDMNKNREADNLTEIPQETLLGMTHTQYTQCKYSLENNRNMHSSHSQVSVVRTPEIVASSRIIHQTSSGIAMQILSHMPIINNSPSHVKIEEVKNVSTVSTTAQSPVIVSTINQSQCMKTNSDQFMSNASQISGNEDKLLKLKEEVVDPLDISTIDKTINKDDSCDIGKLKTDGKVSDTEQPLNTPSVVKIECVEKEEFSPKAKDQLNLDSEQSVQKLETLESKEDSDCWSAKEVNIESVIKKVDALCSAEVTCDNIQPEKSIEQESSTQSLIEQKSDANEDDIKLSENQEANDPIQINSFDVSKNDDSTIVKENIVRGTGRRGKMRGRKSQCRVLDRQTNQAKRGKGITKRGRGGFKAKADDRKCATDLSNDVYEFRDDSGEDNKEDENRPRLILTIKGPTSTPNTTATSTTLTTTTSKPSSPVHLLETKEDFSQPSFNTRKSRRLQERDGSRTTVDDVIEDVIKNGSVKGGQNVPRRSTRQNIVGKAQDKTCLTEVRKSPRARRLKDRSETSIDSSDEKCNKALDTSFDEKSQVNSPSCIDNSSVKKSLLEDTEEVAKISVASVKTPVIALKDTTSTITSDIKSHLDQNISEPESLTLIDPVTGELTVMCQSKEGQYIPVSTSSGSATSFVSSCSTVITTSCVTTAASPVLRESVQINSNAPVTTSDVVIRASPIIESTVTSKPHTLKSHVLSLIPKPALQTCTTITSNQTQTISNVVVNIQKSAIITNPQLPPQTVSLNPIINTASISNDQNSTPRFTQNTVSKIQSSHIPGTIVKTSNTKLGTVAVSTAQSNQYINQKPICSTRVQAIQQLQNQKVAPTIQKNVQMNSNIITQTTNMAIKQNVQLIQGQHGQVVTTIQRHIVTGKPGTIPMPAQTGSVVTPNKSVILTAAVASPPLKQPLMTGQPVVTGASGSRATIPHVSPQGPHSASPSPRSQVMQAGMPMPVFEGAMSESVTHFPMIPMRGVNPRDLSPHLNEVSGYSMYQQYLRVQETLGVTRMPYLSRSSILPGLEQNLESHESMIRIREDLIDSPPLELRRQSSSNPSLPPTRQITAVPHSLQSPHDRATDSPQVAQVYTHSSRIAVPHYPSQGTARFYEGPRTPPPAHRAPLAINVSTANNQQIAAASVVSAKKHSPTAAHQASLPTSSGVAVVLVAPLMTTRTAATAHQRAAMVPLQIDSLLMRLQRYPIMWQGLLALKNDQAAVQMHYMQGNSHIARQSLPCNVDGSTPPLRILQRMRLEQAQIEGVARKMQTPNEHCVLLALPCGHDQLDVLQQSRNLSSGFITYLQEKKAAGIVNIAAPGSNQVSYVVHIFPSCEFSNENLNRIDSDLLNRIADTSHLLIVIATV